MSLDTLAQTFNFEAIHSAGSITYDLEKLKWVNKQWISRIEPEQLTALCRPLLEKAYDNAKEISNDKLASLLHIVKSELVTLNDVVNLLEFYFTEPLVTYADFTACIPETSLTQIKTIIENNSFYLNEPMEYSTQTKLAAKTNNIPLKELFWFLRLTLMGKTHGPSIHELLEILGSVTAQKRIDKALELLR